MAEYPMEGTNTQNPGKLERDGIILPDDHIMSQTQRLTAIIEREGDGYVALCPELDIASQGDTIEEARDNLAKALELFLETASPREIDRRIRLLTLTAEDSTPQTSKQQTHRHSIMELHGLGKEIWEGIDPQEYVNELRKEWDNRP